MRKDSRWIERVDRDDVQGRVRSASGAKTSGARAGIQTQDQASWARRLARLSITNKNSKNVVNSGTIKAAARVA